MFPIVLIALLALGLSFVCSMFEAVLLSITPAYIKQLERADDPAGVRLEMLARGGQRPLVAARSVNVFAIVAGGAAVAAYAASVWGVWQAAVAAAVFAVAAVLLSTVTARTLGVVHWRRLAPRGAKFLSALVTLTTPLTWLARRLSAAPAGREPLLSRDDMSAIAEFGEREGIVRRGESRLLRNVLRFGDLFVRDIMTPRTVMLTADENWTVREFFEHHPNPIFSRIPIYRGEREDISGYVLKSDMLLELARDHDDCKLRTLHRDLLVIVEHQAVSELFEQLVSEQQHIALVVDEYGGVEGVVTMEDVVETLLGLEIVDESDISQDMRELARRRWEQRARRMGFAPETITSPDGGDDDDSADATRGNGHDHDAHPS